VLVLSKDHYIGEGEIRFCYYHPDDMNLCVKIPRENTTRNYTLKEIKYFKKLSKRNKQKYGYKFFSDFQGEVLTNLGLGQKFDLIRDYSSNEVSKTLEHYLLHSSKISDNKIESAIMTLKQMMIKHRVFTRDLRSRNICCRLVNSNNDIELIIIDGIGHRDFFPLADWFYFFSKKKVERIFERWKFNSLSDQRKFLKKSKEI
tara:strand:- start:270 stop:875 length:606 start_codon:yes stop_codon:yes gene_type:complete